MKMDDSSLKSADRLAGNLLGWYAVCTSKTLRGDHLYFFSIFNEALVLYRDKGSRALCVKDFCPHRGASFRGGEVISGEIVCPYHGARFTSESESNGCIKNRCQHIVDNAYQAYSSRICLKQYPCIEKGDYIYIYYTGKATIEFDKSKNTSSLDPLIPELIGFRTSGYAYEEALLDFKCDWSRIVENHLDILHIFWMHGETLPGNDVGRHSISRFDQEIKVDKQYIRTKYFHKQKDKGEFITQIFIPPGRIIMYRGKPETARYVQVLDHIPMSPNRSRVIVRHYRKFIRNRILCKLILFSLLQRRTFYRIFSEDYLVLQTQTFNYQMQYMLKKDIKLLGEDKTVNIYWDWYQKSLETVKPWSIHPMSVETNTIHQDLLMVYPPENLKLQKKNDRRIILRLLIRISAVFIICLAVFLVFT